MERQPSPPLDRRPTDQRTADSIREIARSVRDVLAAGTLNSLARPPVTVVFPGTGAKRIAHGLGNPPTGYFIVRLSADARVFDAPFVAGDDPNAVIYHQASGAVTASIIFF